MSRLILNLAFASPSDNTPGAKGFDFGALGSIFGLASGGLLAMAPETSRR
jgi:hypothetical protein